MGQLVMILGKSGSGKSASLRNFNPGEAGIFNVAGKRLPFQSELKTVDNRDYNDITSTIKANGKRCYVIDDATYLMSFDNFDKANIKGYDKFTSMAVSFYQLLDAARNTDDDTITYFILHPEFNPDGTEKVRTIGKMLDEKLCIEGLFPIVLNCVSEPTEGGKVRHVFVTESNGINLAKAPMGMFEPVIDNDLKAVDTRIREYWGMKPIKE